MDAQICFDGKKFYVYLGNDLKLDTASYVAALEKFEELFDHLKKSE